MKSIISLAALVSAATAVSLGHAKRDSPLDVQLEMVSNTAVKASITNTGSSELKVLKTGTLLDQAPVEKVTVTKGSEVVPFEGVRLILQTSGLPEEAFQVIAAGETVTSEFDIAEFHDLSAGGDFDVSTAGAIPFAEANTTDVTGVASFTSNLLSSVNVDGAEASEVRQSFLDKRTAVQAGCTGAQRTATVNAIARARTLAQTSASQAQSNNARVAEYFKNSAAATKNTVQTVFNRIVSESSSTTSGVSRYFCTDQLRACSGGVIAYTVPSQSYVVNCPIFFSALPATTRACHAQDQQTTVIHEFTHLNQVRGTSDFGGYGYNFVRSLSAAQNLNHADTYALFSQSIFAGC